MTLSRTAWIGGGVLAFAAAVFAMVPPTKPLGGAKIDPDAHHGLAALSAPASPPRAAAAASPPAGFSGQAAAIATPALPWRPADDDATSASAAASPPRTGPTPAPAAPRPDPRYAEAEPEPVSAEEDRAFRGGFRWARQHDVDDPRVCRGLDGGGPASDGCLAFARTAPARDDRDDERADDDRDWR